MGNLYICTPSTSKIGRRQPTSLQKEVHFSSSTSHDLMTDIKCGCQFHCEKFADIMSYYGSDLSELFL